MFSPIRTLSCSLYVFCIFGTLLNVQSYRQLLVFVMSFTFQTNSVMFVYFALGDRIPLRWRPIIQRLAVVWTTFMALTWFCFLGGQETTSNEKVLNHVLHYYQPVLFLADWLIRPALPWASHEFLYFPTLISMGLMFAIGKYHLGYHIYPFFGGIDVLSQIKWKDLAGLGGLIVVILSVMVASFTIYIAMGFVIVDIMTYQFNECRRAPNHAHEE